MEIEHKKYNWLVYFILSTNYEIYFLINIFYGIQFMHDFGILFLEL